MGTCTPAELSPTQNPQFLLCCRGEGQGYSLSSQNLIPSSDSPSHTCPALGLVPLRSPSEGLWPPAGNVRGGGGGVCFIHSELGQRERLSSEAEKQNDPRQRGRMGTPEPQSPTSSHEGSGTAQGSRGASRCHQIKDLPGSYRHKWGPGVYCECGPPGAAEDQRERPSIPRQTSLLLFSHSLVPGQSRCSGDFVALTPGRQGWCWGGVLEPALLSQAWCWTGQSKLGGSGRGSAWPMLTYPVEQSRL